MSAIREFLRRVKTSGSRRSLSVKTVAMGRERVFDAFDIGEDTFVIERAVASKLSEHPSVLLVEKRAQSAQPCFPAARRDMP